MRCIGVLVLLSACGFPSLSPGGAPSDASTDAGMTPPDGTVKPPPAAQQCFGTGLLNNLCLDHAPTGDLTLQNPIDTDDNGGTCTKTFTQAGGPDLCVIAAGTITVAGNVTPTGNRALVLIAADTITIPSGASLDVSSRTANPVRKGAAASPTAAAGGLCLVAGAVVSGTGGAGGGAGGSFGTSGGNGGRGDTNGNGNPAGPNPGRTSAATPGVPTILRGGCAGSAGGNGSADQSSAGPAGGEGGGAMYLIAVNKITVTGDLFASGAGGTTRTSSTGAEEGGGGGGAGGMIGLDAAALQIDGRIAANGGGGGGGGTNTGGGTAGGDGTTTQLNAQAAGGPGAASTEGNGGNGGKGTDVGSPAGTSGADSAGGAGGAGGSVGYTMTWGTVAGGTQVSPALTKH